MNTLCIIEIKSESGDKYGPIACNKVPNDSQLKKLLKEVCPPEELTEDGPGIFGTYLHVTTTVVAVKNVE